MHYLWQASEEELDSFSADDIKEFSPPQVVEFLAQLVDKVSTESMYHSVIYWTCGPVQTSIYDTAIRSDEGLILSNLFTVAIIPYKLR